jgi:hypothetical protein
MRQRSPSATSATPRRSSAGASPAPSPRRSLASPRGSITSPTHEEVERLEAEEWAHNAAQEGKDLIGIGQGPWNGK